jgi:hypothetical protein
VQFLADTPRTRNGRKSCSFDCGRNADGRLEIFYVGTNSIFYHATNGVTATQIRTLNPNAIDLYEYYGEAKKRRITYVQMAELMLREVRLGKTLVGVFGCQILNASRALATDTILATNGHVVFLQLTAVGDAGNATLDRFFATLTQTYGEEQECTYYAAALLPCFAPEIIVRPLGAYSNAAALDSVGPGLLYLPPRSLRVADLEIMQAFGGKPAYGPFEAKAIAELDCHETPAEFLSRRASDSLYRAMSELGTNPLAQAQFRHDPSGFSDNLPNLSRRERLALVNRSSGGVRAVSTF